MTTESESTEVQTTAWNALKTSVKKEADGVWAKYPGTNAEFCIARIGSDEYERDVRAAQREAASNGITNPTSQQARTIVAGPLSRHVLKGWRNVGNTAHSQEEAAKKFADPALKDWHDWVVAVGTNPERYRLEEDAGN